MKNPDNGNTGTPLDPAADLQPESRFRRLLVPVLLFMLGDVFLLGAVAWWLNPNALLKSISLPPSLDPAEARLMALNLSGDYATGDQSGDRTITISEDGSISLGILGSHDTVFSSSRQRYDAIRQAHNSKSSNPMF